MTFTLECKNGKFNLDDIKLSNITDVFSITTIRDNAFCFTDGEFVFSLYAQDDDSITMYVSFYRKLFFIVGKKLGIYSYQSFCNVHLLDDCEKIVFAVSVDK